MLSPATLDLVRRDPEIPGLATVLDPDAFLEALRRSGAPADVESAHIRSVRLEPHEHCQVVYQVQVAGEPLDVEARACRPEDLATKIEEVGETAVPGSLGTGRIVLEDRAVFVPAFPNDRKLPALRDLTDRATLERRLRELLPSRPELWSAEVRALRYRPSRRFVAELRAPSGTRALLKVSTRKGHARSRRNAAAFESRGPLRVARVLGALDEHGMLAFEWLPGAQLFELCVAPFLDREAVSAAGAALATLHHQDPEGLEPWTREAEAAEVSAAAEEIGFLLPRLAPQAAALAQRLARRVAEAPEMRVALHGDFSSRHVLVEGRKAAIIDLDWASRGDPADDIGGILAQIARHAVYGDLPSDRTGSFREAFLRGYRGSDGGRLPERIELYTAVELFRGARFPFRTHEPDWAQRTELLLEITEAVLNQTARTTGAR